MWWWKVKDCTEASVWQSFPLIHHAFQQRSDILAVLRGCFFCFVLFFHIIPLSEISWVENSVVNQRGGIVKGLWSVYGTKKCRGWRKCVVAMDTTKIGERGYIWFNSICDMFDVLELSTWGSTGVILISYHLTSSLDRILTAQNVVTSPGARLNPRPSKGWTSAHCASFTLQTGIPDR